MRAFACVLAAVITTVAGCTDESIAPPGVPPGVAPGAVSDLYAETQSTAHYASSARLHWTVPVTPPGGDPVRQFEVRAAQQVFSGDEWLAVPPALELHAEQPAGTEVTAAVGNLERGKPYAFVVRAADLRSRWSAWSNVTHFTSENTAPVAAFTVGGDSSCPDVPVAVDAGGSADAEDGSALLQVRWDWEGDGIWDTGWSTVKTASHRYTRAGSYPLRLEVLDSGGWRSQTAVRRVERGPVLPTRARRGFEYWEWHYYCPPTSPGNPLPCVWLTEQYGSSTQALGRYAAQIHQLGQVSLVASDTLRFEAGERAPLPGVVDWMQTFFEVDFTVCAEVPYQLSGHRTCDGFQLQWTGPGGVVAELPPCGSGTDFEQHGTLRPGAYHFAARLDAIHSDSVRQADCLLVFGAGAAEHLVSAAPPDR